VVGEDAEGGNRNAPGAASNGDAGAGSETGGASTIGGSGGGVSPGGNGGAARGGGTGSASRVAPSRNRSDCDECISQRQADLQACAVILDCCVSNG
jgi:hypothetical protein